MKKRKLLLSSSVSRAIIIAGLTLSMSVSPVAVYASEDTSETVSGQDTADADSMENAGEAETDNTQHNVKRSRYSTKRVQNA